MSFKEKYLRKQQELYDLQREVREMRKKCPHEQKAVKLVETFAFEYTPRYQCAVCGEDLRDEVSKEDVKKCYKEEWFAFIEERELSEEELEEYFQKHPRGFNLPRRTL